MSFGIGNDTFTNTGTLNGSVTLGAGIDAFNQPKLEGCSRYTTQPGDSVGGIAHRMTDGIPAQRMVALYRGNPTAFNAKNMNQLKANADMGIPCADAVEEIPVSEARQVVGQHARSYVKRHGPFRAGASASTPEQLQQCGE